MKYHFNNKGSILLEGLIVLTLISIMILLIFGYIRNIQDNNTNKIHAERGMLLLTESFEKLRSARDSAINRNIKNGWENFTYEISPDDKHDSKTHKYLLTKEIVKKDGVDISEDGQWSIVLAGTNDEEIFESNVAPYADYKTTIQAIFPYEKVMENSMESDKQNLNKVLFDVTVRWNNFENPEADDFFSIQQSLMLTNHRIYENLY